MCEFNTKITITQLLSLTVVSAKSKIYSPRRGYLSPGNSIILEIAAILLFIIATIFTFTFGAHFLESQARFQQTCLFLVTYARAAYSALPQKTVCLIF